MLSPEELFMSYNFLNLKFFFICYNLKMKENLVILGSTGSIGVNTLEVIEIH